MEEQAYRQQFQLENGHWWFEGRRAVMWALLGRAGVRDGARLLDAGCGTGRNLQEFGRLGPAAGVDPSPEAIEFCRQRGIEGVTRGTIEHLPFPDGAFDLILATDVLEHLRDDRAALRELRRRGRPRRQPAVHRARLPLAVERPRRRAPPLPPLHAARAPRGARGPGAGGRSPRATSTPLLLPPIAAVRLLARRSRRDPEAARPDLRLTPPALNGLLAQPMRAEAALIGRGCRLPAGVSIGVVARAAGSS